MARWLNITLPPEATGEDLARLIGECEALALLRAIAPALLAGLQIPLSRMAGLVLAGADLIRPEKPVHLQVPCTARDEHAYRYAPVAELLRAVQIL